MSLRYAGGKQPITALSGGNQQKVILARWLAMGPRILLLNDPTRGVDISAKREIYRAIREQAAAGVAVVLLSTEIDELIELVDRVLVFREGTVGCELAHRDVTRERLVAEFFGVTDRIIA